MKFSILLIPLIFTILGCSSLKKPTPVLFKLNSHYQKVASTFDSNTDFVEKYMSSDLEKNHSDFYDDLVFNSKVDPNWSKNKKRAISGLAKRFKEKKDKIQLKQNWIYSRAPKILKKTIETIPFDRPIDVVVTPFFTSGGTVRVRKNFILMGVGSNVLIETSHTDWVIPHELTHASHIIFSDFPGIDNFEEWKKDGKLFWGLWTEGIASYGAFITLKPDSLEKVFGFSEYANFRLNTPGKAEQSLARNFLKVMDEKYIDFSDKKIMMNMKNWFGIESDLLGKNTPRSPGYYLGFLVVKNIIDKGEYTFRDILKMRKQTVRALVRTELTKISKP